MSQSLDRAPLSDVCRFQNGGTPSKSIERFFTGDIPWITGADLVGPIALQARSFITEEAIASSATNQVPAGTVLLVTRTSVGKVAIAGMSLCFSQDITALTPDSEKLDGGYLVQFLRTKEEHFAKHARGATIQGITRQVVADLAIPLPPLKEQRRIAAILDQAETLRTQRRAALAQLDSLTQSIFLDMFGDPATNQMGWPRLRFGDLLANIDSGWSPVCLDRSAEDGEWAVLKLGAVTSCEFKPAENKALPSEIAPDPTIEVREGDLLFSRKNTYELVAACALVGPTRARLMMSDLIFRFRLKVDAQLDSTYLHRLLTYPSKRMEVQKLAGGSSSSMPNISKSKLSDFRIEVPPLPLQQTFATRIQAIESLKATHRKALAALDTLFASLQQRAFAGEL
ncbi:MAG: restriction endonuclease subunit S [Rhodoferax sp.]|uniref:restriction endonuclease subunit S n=1 Tax=Rhodoferax sp. TaxID=50421 RepID=UPI0032666F57